MTLCTLDHRDLPALHEYAQEIARELGAPWRYDPQASRDGHGDLWHYAALVTGLSPFGVNVRMDYRRPDRIEISGRIPSKDREGNIHSTWWEDTDGKRPKISVAIARGPGAAARDILKRLIPIYASAYAKAHVRVDKANDDLEQLRRVTALLEPFAHPSRGRDYSGRHDGRFILRDELGTARFSSYASEVELRIGVSPEEAVAVLDMVCDLRGLPRNVGPALKVVGGKGGAR